MIALLLLLAQFYCPVHPAEQAAAALKCAICGRRMVPMPPARFATYPVELRATATTTGVRLRLTVRDLRRRTAVRRFALVDERPMQLFIVGNGLEFFAYDYPVPQADGVFMIDVALPKPGAYMAIAEFVPAGGPPQVFQEMFTTGEPFARPTPQAIDVAPKVVDGVRVSVDATQLKAEEARPLVFRLEDAASGAAIADAQPPLGATVHLLMVSADLTEAIHARRDEPNSAPGLAFAPLVPRAGRYKAWLQFERAGRVSTAAFVFDVP